MACRDDRPAAVAARRAQMGADLSAVPVGAKVRFVEERRAYTVQARSDRFLVCTKPFAARRTVLYTVVDLDLCIRGAENLIFGMGAETREQCEGMIERLTRTPCHAPDFTLPDGEVIKGPWQDRTEVSHRNWTELRVESVRDAGTKLSDRETKSTPENA